MAPRPACNPAADAPGRRAGVLSCGRGARAPRRVGGSPDTNVRCVSPEPNLTRVSGARLSAEIGVNNCSLMPFTEQGLPMRFGLIGCGWIVEWGAVPLLESRKAAAHAG